MFSIRGERQVIARRQRSCRARVESLESRQLLTITASSSFGLNPTTFVVDVPAIDPDPANPSDPANDTHIHNFSVSITNDAGVPSAVSNGVATATINASQLNLDSFPRTVRVSLTGLVAGGVGAGIFLPHSVVIHVIVNGVDTSDVTDTTDLGFNATTMRDTVSFSDTINVPAGDETDSIGIVFENTTTNQSTPVIPFFALTVDTSFPTLDSLGPPSPLRNTPIDSIPFAFSEPINAATFNVSTLSLTRNGTNVPLDGVTIAPIGTSTTDYSISGLSSLTTSDGTYVLAVNVAAIQDTVGNTGFGTSSATFTIDTTRPMVVEIQEVPATTTVPLFQAPVTLSKPVLVTSILPSEITLTRDGIPVGLDGIKILPLQTDIPRDGLAQQFMLEELRPFTGVSGHYVLTVSPVGLIDAAGNTGTGEPISAAFTATIVGPSIARVVPSPPLSDSSVANVLVGFSLWINAATFHASNVSLTFNDVPIPLSGLQFSLDAIPPDQVTVLGLAPFTKLPGTYRVAISSAGIFDPYGNPVIGSSLVSSTFTVDKPAPSLLSVGPEPATLTTPVDTANVTFTQSILNASVTAADVSLTRNGSPIPLNGITIQAIPSNQESNEATNQFTITGLAPFTSLPGDYVLSVSPSGIVDTAGKAAVGGSVSTSFSVIAPARITALAIDGATSRNTPFTTATLTFDGPIDPTSFTPQALTLTLNGSAVALGSGITLSSLTPSTYQIGGLSAFTTAVGNYVLSIDGTTLKDVNGLSVAGSASTAFAVMTDTGAVVTQVTRKSGLRRSTIEITFNRPMDPGSALALANYILLPATRQSNGRGVLPTSTSYDATTQTVSLTFAGPLRPAGYYLIKVDGTVPSGLTDTLTGNALEGQVASTSGGATYASYFGPVRVNHPVKIGVVAPARKHFHKSALHQRIASHRR